MVESSISEFTYGFGLAHELYNGLRSRGITAPIFPSLRDERRFPVDLAFAIRGLPVFLQFKVSDALTTRRATYWNDYGRLYYRFKLYPRNRSPQHNRLIHLSNRFLMVRYCAPLFHTYNEFSSYFASGTIWLNTKWIHLNGFTLIRGKTEHCITYSRKGPTRQRSEPVDGKASGGEEFLTELVQSVKTNSVEIDTSYLRKLWNYLSDIIQEDPSPRRSPAKMLSLDSDDPDEILGMVQRVLRGEFGTELFVFSESGKTDL